MYLSSATLSHQVYAAGVDGVGFVEVGDQKCSSWFYATSSEWVYNIHTTIHTLGLQVPSEKVGLGWVPGGSSHTF